MRKRVKSACGFVAALLAATSLSSPLQAEDLPDYMKGLVSVTESTPADTANANLLALFSGAGGNFTLYQPGKAPVSAPPVPIVYQILKSVGHSTMALTEVVSPFLSSANDQGWVGPALAYRSRLQTALDGIDAASIPAD